MVPDSRLAMVFSFRKIVTVVPPWPVLARAGCGCHFFAPVATGFILSVASKFSTCLNVHNDLPLRTELLGPVANALRLNELDATVIADADVSRQYESAKDFLPRGGQADAP